jgi:toxin ParE1/3/4
MTEVVISPRAQKDLQNITDYYILEAGIEVASAFLSAWHRAISHIQHYPESGSLRLAEATKLRGLRVWPVKGFPHIAVYISEKDAPVIARVLHTSRDIPATLQE